MNSLKQVPFTGISMWPFLKDGDVVEYLDTDEINIGDIALFIDIKDGEIVCHRLIKKNDTLFYFKGDRSLFVEKVQKNSVLGKVLKIKRKNKVFSLNVSLNEMIVQLSIWTKNENPRWLRYFSLITLKLISPFYLITN